MSEEEIKYFKGLIGFTFDSDDIRYIEKIVSNKDKEIERLTDLCNRYEEEHKTTFKIWEKDLKNFEHEKNRKLKSRINKAIEYLGIDEDILNTCKIYDVNGIEVYKILQGSDKE